MAAAGDFSGELERRVMAAVKAAAARGDPPLLQAAEAARCVREALQGAAALAAESALAAALVGNLCFAHNTGALWKLLDQAMASRLVSPLQTLALLTPRVVPNRWAEPEAYRLYLELLRRYALAPASSESAELKGVITKSMDDAMQLSDSYGVRQMDFGHAVVLFLFSIIKILIDCILKDCGLPYISTDEHRNAYATGMHKVMDLDAKGSSNDKRNEHCEYLRRTNIRMALEIVEKITATRKSQIFLRLVNLNIPEKFSGLLQRLQVIGSLKSKGLISTSNTVDKLLMNVQKVAGTRNQFDKSRLLGVLVGTRTCSSVPCFFGAGKGACWIPFDMFMENAMDGRHLHAVSAIDVLTELTKTLQVINRATWQQTFQALWISALRLVQRDRDWLDGPIPHLDSRLCMLLSIVPLSIAPLMNEEAAKLERRMVSVRREGLVSSLQFLGQLLDLLSPPPPVLNAVNTAATKAALFASNLKSGNDSRNSSSKANTSTGAVGNMLHLIVEACIARNLIDTSAYFWPGYVVPVKLLVPVQESPWSAFMGGSPLTSALVDALIATPASSIEELEKLYSSALNGSEEEKMAASKILCGASLLRGWNIQEHVVQMVLKLLSVSLPSDSLDSGSVSCYIHHMPILHALLPGISSVDTVHILSLYGLVPEVAATLMPICEIFGSLPPPTSDIHCRTEKASVYSVFSCAFLFLLRLWKFHRPPGEQALGVRGASLWMELSLDYLLLLRNSSSALQNSSASTRMRNDINQSNSSSYKPVYIDSFPKLRAWYFQNQACIASTLSGACNKNNVLQVANKILNIIYGHGGMMPVSPLSTSSSSVTGSSVGAQEDASQGPPVPAWEILEAVPFVLETVLTACAHGRLSSRDLTTGLRDLVDFLPASLAVVVSYFSAEITRGIWKPVLLNGIDWPSPAATLPTVESEIKELLASAGVHINSCYPRGMPPMLPLPMAALISLTITFKVEKDMSYLHAIAGEGLENCASSSSWPSMPIIGALWAQKARRWHDFIVLSCSRAPFSRDKDTVAQLIRSCFSSFLGPCIAGHSSFTPIRGVISLLGAGLASCERGAGPSVPPGLLFIQSCRIFPDTHFVCLLIFKLVIERAQALANEWGSNEPARLRSGRMPLSAAATGVEQMAPLAAMMLCLAGGVKLIRILYEEVLPTLLLSAGDEKLGSAGPVSSVLEGFALAYVLFLSGAFIWGIGDTSPVYTSVYSSKRAPVIGRHLDFMARAMEGNIVLACGHATFKAYVLCFIGMLVDFVPAWLPEVKLETLQKLAAGLRGWHECDLALSLLERAGPKAMTSVVESVL